MGVIKKEQGTKDKRNSALGFKPFLAAQVSIARNSEGAKEWMIQMVPSLSEISAELQGECQAHDILQCYLEQTGWIFVKLCTHCQKMNRYRI